jgi:MerR family redox-sensitive transcriptional activator SoxR
MRYLSIGELADKARVRASALRYWEQRGLLPAGDTTPSATRQWRDMAARKLPELDRHIAHAQALRQAVADCLECGCMNFDRCLLLDAAEATP